MKKTLNTSLALILVTVLAFVCISKPLQARADSASMDYVETNLSTAEVKALFSGSAAFIPAAIMIIGFIVMCYCVLRNIEVPLQFSDQTSFSDKLTQLGQYAIDNAGDSIKDFLYSVYTYCNDNGITSIWGLSKFIGLQAGKFFGAITSWIGGSLINNPTDIGSGLLNNFSSNPLNDFAKYSYSATFNTYIYNNLGVNPVNYFSTFCYGDTYYSAWYYSTFSPPTFDYCFGLTSDGLAVYRVDGNTASRILQQSFYVMRCVYSSGNSWNVPPTQYNYSQIGFANEFLFSQQGWNFGGIDYQVFLNHLLSYGVAVYSLSSFVSTFDINSATTIAQDVINPASDNVYVPTDVWWLDLAGTWESINANQAKLLDQTEKIAAFVGSVPLTLTAADAYAPTINDAGNYVFPDMTDIWKYPQYFFDTLKGWGMFVGNCLKSVTVGEGGLSWIFYGGFVLLVCGGIIGKILMG